MQITISPRPIALSTSVPEFTHDGGHTSENRSFVQDRPLALIAAGRPEFQRLSALSGTHGNWTVKLEEALGRISARAAMPRFK